MTRWSRMATAAGLFWAMLFACFLKRASIDTAVAILILIAVAGIAGGIGKGVISIRDGNFAAFLGE